jgi:alpha-D-ribose 1-methylphosphonate 5-triphosphate synthase subunit PhnG
MTERDAKLSSNGMRAKRRAAMAVLADSSAAEIGSLLETIGPLPAHEEMRAPENGLVMVRGRVGGDGARFNLGEATVSRAVVRLASGEMGFGYVLGRDRVKARLIALCDALVQTEAYSAVLESKVIAPIRGGLEAQRDARARQVAATKVDFFTLVRGEDSA